eukprot:gene6479-7218_t
MADVKFLAPIIFVCISVSIYQFTLKIEQNNFPRHGEPANTFFADPGSVKAGFGFLNMHYPRIKNRPNWKSTRNRQCCFLMLVLLQCGDINVNPGPAKYPCGVCDKAVALNHRAINCDECEFWVHIKCIGLSGKDYEKLHGTDFTWICYKCSCPNFTDSFFDDLFESENSFSVLNSIEEEDSQTTKNTSQSTKFGPDHQNSGENGKTEKPKADKPRYVRIMTVNCRSLRSEKKRNDLVELITLHEPDIICGTESHLDMHYSSSEVFPSMFDIVRKDRVEGGGGVFIATHKKLLAAEEKGCESDCEAKWVKVSLQGSKPLFIGSFYRQPSRDIQPLTELDKSLKSLVQASQSTPNIVLTGDFNAPDINWSDCIVKQNPEYGYELNQALIDIMNDHDLVQNNQKPTRLDATLDLLFATNPDLVKKIDVCQGMSDHMILLTDIQVNVKLSRKKARKIYIYRKGNMENVKDDMRELLNELQGDKSVEDLWNLFSSKLLSSITKNIPTKMMSERWNIPWMTNSESNDETVQGYSVSKKFWSYIRSKRKDVLGVGVLRKEGKDITNAKDKAEVLNQQYASVFTKENTNSLPSIGDSQFPTISNLEIESQGIAKLLSNLDPKKANGPDQLPTRVLKEAATEIAPILRYIFIKSLESGIVPQAWRNANVVPVYKGKGSKQVAANYRPVSLTSVCCKTLEHIIFKHIMNHCDKEQIIVDEQHGFRSKRSCETQLITALEDIARKRNMGSNVDILILDFSKAFDTVPHGRLMSKLDHYGIKRSTDIGRWISAWLWDRNQQVVVDGEVSSSVKVESGVPQGTVLGPLLFLLFINDITMQIDSHLRLFADDCLLYEEVNDSVMAENLQRNLHLLGQWAEKWKMSFNVSKCYHMSIGPKGNIPAFEYKLNGEILKEVTHHAYLGIEIDCKLKWEEHVTKIVSKGNRSLAFLRRNLGMCPKNIKCAAYFTLVRPHLEYSACAWDPYLKGQKDKIEKVQKKAARFVENNHCRETGTMTNMLEDLRWPTLETRRKYICAL